MKNKIYYGGLSRYHVRIKGPLILHGDMYILPNKWKDNIGSYKLIDKGDCYDSFEIYPDGRERPMSVNKAFIKEELQKEIKEGYLVSPLKMWLIRIVRLLIEKKEKVNE